VAALPDPPRRIEPGAFYATYAPGVWSAFFGGLDLPPFFVRLDCTVDGDRFALEIDGPELRLLGEATGTPLFAATCTREAWEVAVLDIWPRFVRFAQPKVEAARKRLVAVLAGHPPQERLDRLPQLAGTLEIELTDDAGDVSVYTIAIAGGQGPRGRVILTDASIWTLLRSTGKLTDLLKTRARLDGDVGWVLRLARLLESA
jgi:hypothetical protein